MKNSDKQEPKKQENPRQKEIKNLQQCFRILYVENHPEEIMVPSCVQFKIKNFTDVNFENLSAQVNGVLCISFLIFTHDKNLENMLLDRLYWNPEEQAILENNRKKKIERTANFLPVTFNKDITVKIPTTRCKEFQIQAFKSPIKYQKCKVPVEGWRIFHLVRKEFTVEIIKSPAGEEFWAPYNFINLDMTVTLDHMEVGLFDYNEAQNKQRQKDYVEKLNQAILQAYPNVFQVEKEDGNDLPIIKRISFNNLRLEEHMNNPNPKLTVEQAQQRLQKLAPMITNSSMNNFGKYEVAETYMQAYTFDEREVINMQEEKGKSFLFEDSEPTQLQFKPFKYAIFKIPLYRFPVVDMMTIFIPIWLLGFISVYVFYQTTEIMNRIINVAGLMIAYAAVQPIVRENLPDATTLTLVDLLIYMQILTNILFLVRSISIRDYFDDDTQATDPSLTNTAYDRWEDGLFIASVVLTILNVIIVVVLILSYLFRRGSYKGKAFKRNPFSISKNENWTLKLMMERSFARYRNPLHYFDQMIAANTK